jgi:hypothetical protein
MGRKIAVGSEETEWFSVRAWVVVRALTVLPGPDGGLVSSSPQECDKNCTCILRHSTMFPLRKVSMDASGCSNLILFFHADQLQTSNLTPVRFDNHAKWVRDPSESASTNLRMQHSGRKRRGGHIGCTTSTVRLARLKLLRRDEKKDNMRNGLHSASSNNPAFHSHSLSIC